ncbi:hypothetical protein COV87_03750 [Candidatus Roizmanbacteria bacterium CG11_big_fil_rev_8_21_14_0_20_37_16]|uniref:Uncharacterized protein n=1 Tax=Candidatus Roizmanbacteria bacterium CG11_big_fil_rev_8_21_14_0_20_37_16 TaxID=1974857 RepID=A0A2H0KJG0_9BACT|nr:MAG: hypothetical protein COV87_03750 [Candidatus Roizmanbacteria bacterium CG11_big_fil_rev_8_21_14_0_20_37_16]
MVKTNAVERLLQSDEALILSDVTISEIMWVLSSYYEEEKTDSIEKMTYPAASCEVSGVSRRG